VIQQLQSALHDAATHQPYFEYLNTKYEWQETSKHTMHWPVICLSLKCFKATEHQTVVKFIHEWLPLQDRHHIQSTSTLHLCPSCNQQPETVKHFLTCPHPAQQQVWKDLHEALHKHQIQNGVSNIFHDILAYGLYQGCQAPTQLTFHHLPHNISNLYQSQERLGWKQLYYGQFATQWIPLLTHYHPQLNGLHYITKIVVLSWQSVLQVWGLRNAHLHPGNLEQEDRSQLQAAINQIFSKPIKTLSYKLWSSIWTQTTSCSYPHAKSNNG